MFWTVIQLAVFFVGQLLINRFFKLLNNDKATYVFCSISIIPFTILMFLYPVWSWQIVDFLNPPPPGSINCGNWQMIGAILQWIIGIPLTIVFQVEYNKRWHKLDGLIQKFEKKKD
ncbi:MAG: hypothetical protein WCL14_02415 [Bacteroidota bacterium]